MTISRNRTYELFRASRASNATTATPMAMVRNSRGAVNIPAGTNGTSSAITRTNMTISPISVNMRYTFFRSPSAMRRERMAISVRLAVTFLSCR